MKRAWYGFLYYISWAFFGGLGLLLNLVCLPLLLLPKSRQRAACIRRLIQWLFGFWLRWLHACGVVDVRWRGFEGRPLAGGTVFVANHPTLVDATVLLARLPDAVCVFKPSLLRNPVIGPAARVSGYIAGQQGVDTVRAAAEALKRGCSLLVFPEGTRTEPGRSLNPLKPGFALIARRAQAPIQVILLRASPDLVPRGRSWWKLPPLPGWIEATLDQHILPEPGCTTLQLVERVEARLTLARAAGGDA